MTNISDLIEFLNGELTYWSSYDSEDKKLPFDLLPNEYLQFAEEDLEQYEKRSLVNALSNAKRSLDCQIESLLYILCLKKFADKERMNIPRKIELLKSVGIIAPRILKKINNVRNTMEHDFYCPNIDEVQDFIDVILLFNSYTNKYLDRVNYNCEIENDEYNDFFIRACFNRIKQNVTIFIIHNNKKKEELVINASNKLFIEFLKTYVFVVDC